MSGGKDQVCQWVQVWAPACHLAISPKAIPESNPRLRRQNQLSSSWGALRHCLAGRTGEHKHRAFPSLLLRLCCSHCWLRPAGLRKTCYHSCDTDLVQESKRFSNSCFVDIGPQWALFFSCEMKFSMQLDRRCCRLKSRLSLRSILQSFIGLWVEIWHRIKTACSESNLVQSGRSESTTCPRKGCLLRFELNSTATWDCGAQMLGNDVWRNSESIAIKVCRQIGRKWNVMFESHIVTSVDKSSFKFRFEDVLSNFSL